MQELPKVFISYSHKDKEFANKLHQDLSINGIYCWIDDVELKIGDSILQRISNDISKMNYLAVILSENSIDSKWVNEELGMAFSQSLSNNLIILPLKIDDCELPLFLSSKNYCDFQKNDYSRAFKKLTDSIVDGRKPMRSLLGLENINNLNVQLLTTEKIASILSHYENILNGIITDMQKYKILDVDRISTKLLELVPFKEKNNDKREVYIALYKNYIESYKLFFGNKDVQVISLLTSNYYHMDTFNWLLFDLNGIDWQIGSKLKATYEKIIYSLLLLRKMFYECTKEFNVIEFENKRDYLKLIEEEIKSIIYDCNAAIALIEKLQCTTMHKQNAAN